jgi:hypothetical protein
MGIGLQILNNVRQQVGLFHLAPNVIFQPGEMDVKVIKLGLVVHKDTELVLGNPIHLFNHCGALVEHFTKDWEMVACQVSQASHSVSLEDPQAVQIDRTFMLEPIRTRDSQRIRMSAPL